MNAQIRPLMLALALAPVLSATAQQPPAPEPAQPAQAADRIERITHEDDLSRIDELRVGGQTKSIQVQPKNGAPAYQITTEQGLPPAKGDVAGQRTGNAGRSSWRILSF
jgi:starvation-inducible outer membrane lipoprotein